MAAARGRAKDGVRPEVKTSRRVAVPPHPHVQAGRNLSPLRLGHLEDRVGYQLRRAQLVVLADFVETLGALGLRPATYGVLEVIDANPGASPASVGDALGIQRANFVPLIAGLCERALVRRSASRTDRRSHELHLTPAGRRTLQQARGLVDAHEARLSAALGVAGRRQLLRMLEALAALAPRAR